jgi:FkbM family methyltransferase
MDRLKGAIKRYPLLYRPMLPVVNVGRRVLYSWMFGVVRKERERMFARRLRRFRASCLVLTQQVEHPVFVKVGANDGITGDPCSDILLDTETWQGLLIEPVPSCFARLQANFSDRRRFTLEQVAIGPKVANEPFYYVDERAKEANPWLPEWYDQLGSFDRNHILKHLNGALEPFIQQLPVQVLPLTSVLARYGHERIDLLHIDTEGYDDIVLETLDFERYRPLLILIEHKHLTPARKSAMRARLRAHGYLVENVGSDYAASLRRRRLSLVRNTVKRDRTQRAVVVTRHGQPDVDVRR